MILNSAGTTMRVKSPLTDYGSDELKQQFIDLCEKNNYSFVLVSYVHWAKIIKYIKLRAETILTIEDFISLNKFDRLGDEYNLGASINEEIERVRLFDKAICISREEMNFFERVCKRTKFYYVPHFSEEREIKNEKKEFDLLFVGSDNPFNVRGMSWFFDNVYTRLADNLKIAIIGGVNKELLAYRSKFKNVMFTEFVRDIDAIYQKSKIAICPLKGGTGLKVKVVEAMSFGLPIVTTKYGLLSIDGSNNGCIQADAPQDFASAIERLISDDSIYTELSKSAFDYFRNNFSRDIAYKRLDEVFAR
jgi:glycosyltransferase involved in cell wall biosynthesis